jgi:hypothetical protein
MSQFLKSFDWPSAGRSRNPENEPSWRRLDARSMVRNEPLPEVRELRQSLDENATFAG